MDNDYYFSNAVGLIMVLDNNISTWVENKYNEKGVRMACKSYLSVLGCLLFFKILKFLWFLFSFKLFPSVLVLVVGSGVSLCGVSLKGLVVFVCFGFR